MSIRVPRPESVDRAVVVVPHESTGGTVSFVEQSMAPRALIPGHVHERHDVWVHVLSGLVGVRVSDEEAVGEPGDYLLKPRGVPHAMWNPGAKPNRLVEVLTPGDGDLFFRGLAELGPDPGRDRFLAVCDANGISWFHDWTPDLCARHGLEV